MNDAKVESFIPTSHWFKQWENDYGLSMRSANRKYEVARPVVKERFEIFLISLYRLRLFIFKAFGYMPHIENFDQSPYHNNETGAQNKPVLGVRGSKIPIVEGNNDVKKRWTGNLTTFSDTSRIERGSLPYCELCFKAESDGRLNARLQDFHRSRGFPSWFSVTTSPKGSYREQDIVAFLDKHLEKMTEGRDWRILLADDFSAHKTQSVRRLCWSRGYVLLIHGGGLTPVCQTPDTDLNQHVRREYGILETRLLIDKMRDGDVVPKVTPEECMELMFQVLSDPSIHLRAAAGYRKTGQTIDLWGKEDAEVCREAGGFWNEETTNGYPSMRARLDVELTAVAEEFASGGLTWSRRNVERLIKPYPPRPAVDAILDRLGDDYYLDDLHHEPFDAAGGVDENAAVADDASSEEDVGPDEATVLPAAAVAGDGLCPGGGDSGDLAPAHACVVLNADQAETVQEIKTTVAALQEAIGSLRAAGALRAMQSLEQELVKHKRRERELARTSPAIADAFAQRRHAEAQEVLRRRRLILEQNEREQAAKKAKHERDAAVAELMKHKKAIQDFENLRETKHAMKTFTEETLGQGSSNAGGAKCRTRRFEVLDRMARLGAGLSPGQKNDWAWFKDKWDLTMVTEHKANWGSVFAGWMQGVLEDENNNAFSVFVYNETSRIFKDCVALHVP